MMSDHNCGSDANAIGFFKILPEGHLQGEEFMIIPRSFERKYKITLPNPLFLRLPNGAEWRVSWIKHNYDIWFQQDWKFFAQDCSLRDPHLLVFKYEGGSNFQVRILDLRTYYDIDYSSIRCTNDEVENDDSAEILVLESEIDTQLPKKRKTNSIRGVPSTTTNVEFDATQHKVSTGAKRGRGGMVKDFENSSKAEAIIKQKPSALEKALNYKTNNPSFNITMKPSYLQRNILVLPKEFSKKFLVGFKGTASIGVSEDRTKLVRIGFNNCSNQAYMTSGWISFCKEYKLKVGDVCVFERTKFKPLSFKVIIFRDTEELKELQGYGNYSNQLNQDSPHRIINLEHGRSRNRQFGKRSEGIPRSCPKSGFLGSKLRENKFKIHIRNYHLKTNPHLRKGFFEKYPTCDGNAVKLQVGKKWWPVKVINYPHLGIGLLSGGWKAFVRECKLKVEKIWEFDMIDEENLVFNVSIS